MNRSNHLRVLLHRGTNRSRHNQILRVIAIQFRIDSYPSINIGQRSTRTPDGASGHSHGRVAVKINRLFETIFIDSRYASLQHLATHQLHALRDGNAAQLGSLKTHVLNRLAVAMAKGFKLVKLRDASFLPQSRQLHSNFLNVLAGFTEGSLSVVGTEVSDFVKAVTALDDVDGLAKNLLARKYRRKQVTCLRLLLTDTASDGHIVWRYDVSFENHNG